MFAASCHAHPPTLVDFDQSVLSRLLTVLMDRFECGILSCGQNGELFHANIAGRRELDRARVLEVIDGRVRSRREAHAEWTMALREACVDMRARLVALDDGGDRLMIALMPVRVEGLSAPACLVMLGRQVVCSQLGLEMLSSRHGLTFAERRVFRALVNNHTAREIAASHGVAIATVRTQIQAVRDKIGVRSIDALLLRAAEMPPVSAQY